MREESDTLSSSSSARSHSMRRLSVRIGERLKIGRKKGECELQMPPRKSSTFRNLAKPLPPSPPVVSKPVLESTSSMLADRQQGYEPVTGPKETELQFGKTQKHRSFLNLNMSGFSDSLSTYSPSSYPNVSASPATSFHSAFSHEIEEAFTSGPHRVQSIPAWRPQSSSRATPSSQFRTLFPSTSRVSQASRGYIKPEVKARLDEKARELRILDRSDSGDDTVSLSHSHGCVDMSIGPLPLPNLPEVEAVQQSHSALPISSDNFAIYKASMQHLDNMRRLEIRSLRERIQQLEAREHQNSLQGRGGGGPQSACGPGSSKPERVRGLPRLLPIGSLGPT